MTGGCSSTRIGAAAPVLWGLTAICLAYAVFRLHGFYQDDAFIALTYARNLLAGKGLTWADGERIEGYSDFLFVALIAGVGALGIDLVSASRIVGATFGVATAVAGLRLWATSKRESAVDLGAPKERALTSLYAFLLLTSVPLVAWSIGGLETTLFAFLITMGAGAALRALERADSRPASVAGLWYGLAILTRPDGGVLWLATLVFVAARGGSRRAQLQKALMLAAATAMILMPYAAWKLRYFGDLLPNTWYAKSAGIPLAYKLEHGLSYLSGFVRTPPALALFAATALILRRLGAARGNAIPLAVWSCFAFATYQVVVGGDFMAHFRFFAPLVPLLALVVVGVARELLGAGRGQLAVALALAVVFLSVVALVPLETAPGSASALVAEIARAHLESDWPPGALVAVNASGALPYLHPEYRYLDMLGLNDRHIARRVVPEPRGRIGHLKGEGDYVLGRRPDYLLLGFPYGADELEPVFLGDREILADPRLDADYRKRTVPLQVPSELAERLASVADEYPDLRFGRGTLLFTYYERITK